MNLARQVSVRVRLTVLFLLLLLIPLCTLGGISYNVAENSIQDQISRMEKSGNENVNTVINNVFTPEESSIQFLANELKSSEFNSPAMVEKLDHFQTSHAELMNTFVGNEKGGYINSPQAQMPAGYDPRKRPWYKLAMEHKGEVVITDPYQAASVDAVVVTVARTLEDGTGVVGIDLNLNNFSDQVKNIKIGKTGYTFVLDKQGNVVVHPKLKSAEKAVGEAYNQMMANDSGEVKYLDEGREVHAFYGTNKNTGWKVVSLLSTAEAKDEAYPIFFASVVTIVISIIIGLLILYVILRSVHEPLKQLKIVAGKVQNGDLSSRVEVYGKDELSDLGHSFNHMIESLSTVIYQITEKSHLIASSSEQLTASAEQSSSATEHVATMTQEMSEETMLQSQSIERIALAIEEITKGIQQIASNAQAVSSTSLQTLESTEQGNCALSIVTSNMSTISQTVEELAKIISRLNDRSKEINQIVGVITEIANQTNLLSLNAAIEAARAGEHGKGFAVVAQEVRNLAEQSSKSADEIKNLIQTVQNEMELAARSMNSSKGAVANGLQSVNDADGAFQNILQSMNKVSSQIQEVSASVQQISDGIEGIHDNAEHSMETEKRNLERVMSISASAEEQLASTEEIHASSSALSSIADSLQESVDRFKL
ncbi:methyl-accepting chemotaxis protein [Brevibacillus ginsengisoli]|uniref:methyl-accepting chemotaxis protein n=1 Tax=Brevibacillus ginsengisoli TaxID=363854 RepID=UPI003CE6918C